ncbi:hypothetical protein IFVP182_C260397 [Vibrio parahaemolyticus]
MDNKGACTVVFVAKRIINVVIKASITTISGSIFQLTFVCRS